MRDPFKPVRRFFNRIRWFFSWISKSISYAKFLWNDFDFDYCSIFHLLKFKFQRMKKAIEEDGMSVESPVVIDQLSVAATCIDIILNDEFAMKQREVFDKKWGEYQMIEKEHPKYGKVYELVHANVKTEEDKDECCGDLRRLLEEEERQRSDSYREFFDYMRDNVRNWWD